MDAVVALVGLAVVHLLAVASPGPSTVLVVQTAAVAGRRAGLVAAFAMALGALAWAAAALYGLQALFAHFTWLYRVFQVAGGLFLIYLAVMIWRHARDPLPEIEAVARGGDWQVFTRALLLQLGNPKIMVFFGSIFLPSCRRACRRGWRSWCWSSWPSMNSPGRAARPGFLGQHGARLLPPGESLARPDHGRRAGASWPAPRPVCEVTMDTAGARGGATRASAEGIRDRECRCDALGNQPHKGRARGRGLRRRHHCLRISGRIEFARCASGGVHRRDVHRPVFLRPRRALHAVLRRSAGGAKALYKAWIRDRDEAYARFKEQERRRPAVAYYLNLLPLSQLVLTGVGIYLFCSTY